MSIKDRDTMFLVKLALLAIITRFLFALSYHIAFILSSKEPLYAFDGEFYSAVGWYIGLVLKGVNLLSLPARYIPAECWHNDRLFVFIADFAGKLPTPFQYGIGCYSYMMGLFYFIFGYVPVLFRLLNIVLSVATAILCYLLAKNLFNKDIARVAFVSILLLPSQFIYSASLLRDTSVNFFMMLLIYGLLTIKRYDKPAIKIRRVIYVGISILFLFLLRGRAAFIVTGASLFYAILVLTGKYRWLFSMLIIVFLLAMPLYGDAVSNFFDSKMAETINHHIGFVGYGGFTYKLLPEQYYGPEKNNLLYFSFILPADGVFMILRGLEVFMLEPNLFNSFKLRQMLLLPEMMLWYGILIFSIIGIFGSFRRIDLRIVSLLLLLLFLSSMIVIAGGNMEALVRHRGMVIPGYAIFAGYGYSIIRRKAVKRR